MMKVRLVLCVNKNLMVMNHGSGSERALVNELSPMLGGRREAIQS